MLRWGSWLTAVRDGFVSLLPLTFFRVAATLVQQLPWPAYQRWMVSVNGLHWHKYLDQIIRGTNYVFGLALAVFVAIHLSNRLPNAQEDKNLSALTVGLASMISFVLLSYGAPFSDGTLGANALLLAVFVAILTTELLHASNRVTTRHFNSLPYDTEITFYQAMRASVSVILVGTLAFLLAQLFAGLPIYQTKVSQIIFNWAQVHGDGLWWLSSLVALLNQVFWSIGFHGGLMLDAYFSNLFVPIYGQNGAWRPMLDSFVLIGGAGATLGMLFAIAIVAKDGVQLKIAKLAALPSVFNINDILLYGLPIVLNPRYLVPFIGVPVLLTLITLGAAQSGFVVFNGADVSWTTPPLISGWMLTGSWHGVALQLFEIVLSILLYVPFVRRAEVDRMRYQSMIFDQAKTTLMNENQVRESAIRMQGQVGIIARGLLADLRYDIKTKNLKMVYQPKHDIEGKVVGVEALLRWQNANHGNLSPIIAVTLAEDSGDIHQLGAWALEEACACKARWNALGYQHLVISVNLSPEQLKRKDFPQILLNCLQKYHLNPDEIELEITESSSIPDTLEVEKTLQEVSASGVRISMDDFGMGYSSLLYLRRIKVNAIKIDGSLTRDVLINDTNADIIRAITALGKTQNVDVVAEFVETIEQRDALVAMGCNLLQGNLLSAPLSESECLAYLHQNFVK